MKKTMLSAAILLLSTLVFAQSEKYTSAMKKNLAAMDSAFKNPPDLLAAANNFERIAAAEKTQWLPYYYAAFCQVNYGFIQQDKSKTDGYADKAAELIAKADSLSPNNSEISCLKSMVASCHLMVDPATRWQQYGQESSNNIDAAISQDPNNPRPHFLKGQGLPRSNLAVDVKLLNRFYKRRWTNTSPSNQQMTFLQTGVKNKRNS